MSDQGTPPPAPPPTPPPETQPPANWRDGLPDDLKANPSLATIPDVKTLAQSFVATKALTGKKAYDLPQANWTPEQHKEWNKLIGVPEAPDKYTPMEKAQLEKAGIPPETLTAAMTKFHEAGLTDRQAKSIVEWFVGDAVKGGELLAEQQSAARVAGETALKQEFGDRYQAKMGLVKAWLKQNADADFLDTIEKNGLGNDPKFIKAIIKSAEATLESDSRTGNVSSPMGAESAAALAEIEQMKGKRLTDRAFSEKFNDPRSPERIRWEQLHKIAFESKS